MKTWRQKALSWPSISRHAFALSRIFWMDCIYFFPVFGIVAANSLTSSRESFEMVSRADRLIPFLGFSQNVSLYALFLQSIFDGGCCSPNAASWLLWSDRKSTRLNSSHSQIS